MNLQLVVNQAQQIHQQGTTLLKQKDPLAHQYLNKAKDLYEQVLNVEFKNPDVLFLYGTTLMQMGRSGAAMAFFEKVLSMDPNSTRSWNNLGACYRQENYREEALNLYVHGLRIKAEPDLFANMCAAWVNEGHPENGIPFGRVCLTLNPTHPQGLWNLGLLLMENGEYEEGFALYNRGFETGDRVERFYVDKNGNDPKWMPDPSELKPTDTLVLWGEQGIGDELLFSTFVPCLKDKCNIILDVHPRLVDTFKRTFPWVKGIYPTRKTTPEWAKDYEITYKQAMGSLPAWFHKDRAKYSGMHKADPKLVKEYKNILYKLHGSKRPIIGVHWAGGTKKTRTDLRSLPLSAFAPLLKEDAIYVSFQYTPDADKEVGALFKEHGITVWHINDIVKDFNYDRTVALAEAVDLMITVNTSIAHVCGVIGKKCWTLTPWGHAWRYGKRDEFMPFYKTVRNYHQHAENDWSQVFPKVHEDLKEFIKSWRGK